MTISLEPFHGCRRCGLGEFSRTGNPVFGKLTYIQVTDEHTEFSHFQMIDTDDPVDVDIMFLGEAPGRVEDTRGLPFVGPSGALLEKMIAGAMELYGIEQLSTYITNIVACRPCDSIKSENRPPTDAEVWACSERFQTELAMAAPRRVIFLGETAFNNGRKVFKSGIKMYHPAYILRQGGESSAVYLQFIRDLGEIINACYQEKQYTSTNYSTQARNLAAGASLQHRRWRHSISSPGMEGMPSTL